MPIIQIYPDTGPGTSSSSSSSTSFQTNQTSQSSARSTSQSQQTSATYTPHVDDETTYNEPYGDSDWYETDEEVWSRSLPALPDIYYDELHGSVRKRGETLYTVGVKDSESREVRPAILRAKDTIIRITRVVDRRPEQVQLGRPPASFSEMARKYSENLSPEYKLDVGGFWRHIPAIPDTLYKGKLTVMPERQELSQKWKKVYTAEDKGRPTAVITTHPIPIVTMKITPDYEKIHKALGPHEFAIGGAPSEKSSFSGTIMHEQIKTFGVPGSSPGMGGAFVEGLKVGTGSLLSPVWNLVKRVGVLTTTAPLVQKTVEEKTGKQISATQATGVASELVTRGLSEMSKPDFDIRQLNLGESFAYFAGYYTPYIVASYFSGELAGAGAGRVVSSSVGRTIAGKTEPLVWNIKQVFSNPMARQAASGLIKGTLVGGVGAVEAIKTFQLSKAGFKPYQIAMVITGDIATIGAGAKGFQKGFASTYSGKPNTDIIIERQWPEGQAVESYKIRQGNLVDAEKWVKYNTGRMEYIAQAKYKPEVGYGVRGYGYGQREVRFLLTEGTESVPWAKMVRFEGANKYRLVSMGGPKYFYLYDPLKGQSPIVTTRETLIPPELRNVIRMARPELSPGAFASETSPPMVVIPSLMTPIVGQYGTPQLETPTTQIQLPQRIQVQTPEMTFNPFIQGARRPTFTRVTPEFAPLVFQRIVRYGTDEDSSESRSWRPSGGGGGKGGSNKPSFIPSFSPSGGAPTISSEIDIVSPTFTKVPSTTTTSSFTQVLTQTQLQTGTQIQTQDQKLIQGFVPIQILVEEQTQTQISLPQSVTPQARGYRVEIPTPPKPPSTKLTPPSPLKPRGHIGPSALSLFGGRLRFGWAKYVGYESLPSFAIEIPKPKLPKAKVPKLASMPRYERPKLTISIPKVRVEIPSVGGLSFTTVGFTRRAR